MENNLVNLTEYRLRPLTLQDAEETVTLFNHCSTALLGMDDTNLEEMRNAWATPGFDFETCARVLVSPDEKIVGYAEVWDIADPHVNKYCWFELDPDHWNDKLASRMLDWAEETAQNRIRLAPEDTRIVLSQGVYHINEKHAPVLLQTGFHLQRQFLRMVIEMETEPKKPVYPEGFEIRKIAYDKEFRDAIMATSEAFEDHWGFTKKSEEDELAFWKHRLENDPEFDPSLWYLATDGDQIAGICLCFPKLIEDPEMGWVSELAVRRPLRCKGLVLALLQHAFYEFYRRGQHKVGLNIDADSLTKATELYIKAGMRIDRQSDAYHKELHAGRDLSTQTLSSS